MILRPFSILMSACVIGVAISVIAAALKMPHAIDPFTAAALTFSLAIGVMVSIAALRLAYAALLFAIALALLLAPIAVWLADLIRDPFGRRARSAERALIDRLYPPPSPNGSRHVQA